MERRIVVRSGSATLAVQDAASGDWVRDEVVVGFAEPGEGPAILGHLGFLEFFTATFDGQQETLELTANGTIEPFPIG